MGTRIWSDGATVRTNPGLLTWGVYVEAPTWTIRFCGRAGYGTSYKAELLAIEKALKFSYVIECYKPTLYIDSETCVRIIEGAYRAKKYVELVNVILDLKQAIRPTIIQIPSIENRAHAPAQECKV